MSNITFKEDPSSQKVTRVLLLMQATGLFLLVCLGLMDLLLPAVVTFVLTLLVLAAGLLWLSARYRNIPIIREKQRLEYFVNKFERHLKVARTQLRAATGERDRLIRAEQAEIEQALEIVQEKHMEAGLAEASIAEAIIPSLDPRLKDQLARQGIHSAAEITDAIAELPGFDAAKLEALLSWQYTVMDNLERSKPRALNEKQLKHVGHKYQAWQEKNGAVESRARASREILEHEILSFRPRLAELAALTFPRYLTESLAARGKAAAPHQREYPGDA